MHTSATVGQHAMMQVDVCLTTMRFHSALGALVEIFHCVCIATKIMHYTVNAELRIPAAANVGRLYELGGLPAACTGPFLGPTRVSNHMEETCTVLKCIGLSDAVSERQES